MNVKKGATIAALFVGLVIIFFAAFFLLAPTPEIAFTDPVFELAIKQAMNHTGELTHKDIAKVTELNLRQYGIHSIEGIEVFKNLRTLDLRDNHIEDLQPLEGLKFLETLNLRNNQVNEIAVLSSLTRLRTLNLRENKIEDIASLAGLKYLQDLNLRYNRIASIEPLRELAALQGRLYLTGNPIVDFEPVLAFYDSIALVDFDYAYLNDYLDIMDLYFYVASEDLNTLYTRSVRDNERIPGYVRIGSQEAEAQLIEGLRFRGMSSRHVPKKSFNVRFMEGQAFLFGSDRMNLNAMWTDSSMLREHLSYKVFRDAGILAPKTRYFNVYINDVFEGFYVHVERVDENLLANAGFNMHGTLVRDNLRENPELQRNSLFGFDLAQVQDRNTFLEQNFEFRGRPNWDAVAELARWVHVTPAGEDYAVGFSERVDLEQYASWLALHLILGDLDSFGDDYWLYLDHEDPEAKWQLIPWDKDLTFGSHYRSNPGIANDFFGYAYTPFPITSTWDNEMLIKFMETPELRATVFDRALELMEDFPPAYFEQELAKISGAIEAYVDVLPGENRFEVHPKNHHGEYGFYEYHLDTIQEFIKLRYAFLQTRIMHDGLPEEELLYYAAYYDPEGPNEAMRVVPGSEHALLFVDDFGWVLGTFTPTQNQLPPESIAIEMLVEPAFDDVGVNMIWRITTEQRLQGEFTLYYRNDNAWMNPGNWFLVNEEIVAIGEQWELQAALLTEEGIDWLPTEMNPYANKAVFQTTLEGNTDIVLLLPERVNQ